MSVSRRLLLVPLLSLPPIPAVPRAELRDRNGRLLGWTAPRSGSIREARDRNGRLLGTYDERTNETRDEKGRLLYRGDALSALILCRGS
ncbi:MAG: hypothetical protein WHT08_03605 [Bryobacteraceae bacterium]